MTTDRPATGPTDRELAAMIRDIAGPPPQVDIDVATRNGTRRIRRRRAMVVAGAAAVTVLAVAALPAVLDVVRDRTTVPAAPVTCTVTRLPEPAGAQNTVVTATDPTGRQVAATAYFPQEQRLRQMIWVDGVPRMLDLPGGAGRITDVNSHGVAVGTSSDADDVRTAWIYRDGRLSRLPGDNAEAIAINDRGDVVGNLYQDKDTSRPVMWRNGQGVPVPLTLPPGTNDATAQDIAEDGRVIGHVGASNPHDRRPYLWPPNGPGRRLSLPSQVLGGSAEAIRGDWVVGGAITRGGPVTLRWNLRTGVVDVVRDEYGNPTINARGWVAGDLYSGAPALDTGAGAVALPGLGADHSDPARDRDLVETLTDDGRTLVGSAYDRAGNRYAVVWRCT